MTRNPKHHTDAITNELEQAGTCAMLKATHLSEEDPTRPLSGVANTDGDLALQPSPYVLAISHQTGTVSFRFTINLIQ